MTKQVDNDEVEIIDAKSGKLEKIGKDAMNFIGNIAEKIGDLPSFAKDILISSDKSEENYHNLVKQDKDVIELVLKQKLESGNYTDEELNDLLDRTQRITENQEEVLDKSNKHKRETLLILSGCMIGALKLVIDSRNNKA